jgi:hypothetical protein
MRGPICQAGGGKAIDSSAAGLYDKGIDSSKPDFNAAFWKEPTAISI